MHSTEQSANSGSYFLIKWQNLVMPYIEYVRDGLYSISFNGRSASLDQRLMDRIYRSGWVSFTPSTNTFNSGFENPAVGSIVEDIVKSNYFASS